MQEQSNFDPKLALHIILHFLQYLRNRRAEDQIPISDQNLS